MAVLSFPDIAEAKSIEDAREMMKSPVAIGTAFSVTPNRFLTCNHVVKNSKTLKLFGSPHTSALPRIVHDVVRITRDEELDLALLETNRLEGEVVLTEMESHAPEVGLDVLAVGYPLPEQQLPKVLEAERRIHVESVIAFRAVRGIVASKLVDGVHFEIDKQLNPGQSGGPIVSIDTGKIIGMCKAYRCFIGTDGKQMPAELGIFLSVHAIRNKLNELGLDATDNMKPKL